MAFKAPSDIPNVLIKSHLQGSHRASHIVEPTGGGEKIYDINRRAGNEGFDRKILRVAIGMELADLPIFNGIYREIPHNSCICSNPPNFEKT